MFCATAANMGVVSDNPNRNSCWQPTILHREKKRQDFIFYSARMTSTKIITIHSPIDWWVHICRFIFAGNWSSRYKNLAVREARGASAYDVRESIFNPTKTLSVILGLTFLHTFKTLQPRSSTWNWDKSIHQVIRSFDWKWIRNRFLRLQ